MNRNRKIGFLKRMILLGFFSTSLFSQPQPIPISLQPNIKFEHFTTEDGLGHNHITSILQDKQGFLWVGTLGGLWRYDGYDFKFARYHLDDTTGLSYPEVQCLYEDSGGNLWAGMQRGGVDLFDRKTGNATRYKHNPDDTNSLSDGVVHTIYETPQNPGILWIGTATGLCRMKIENEGNTQFLRYQHEPGNKNSLSHNVVYTICQDSSNALWIGTHNGLNRFDPQSENFSHYKPSGSLTGISDDNIVRSMVNDGDSLLWLGTFNGFRKFDLRRKTFAVYRHDPGNPHSISHNNVYSCLLYTSPSPRDPE